MAQPPAWPLAPQWDPSPHAACQSQVDSAVLLGSQVRSSDFCYAQSMRGVLRGGFRARGATDSHHARMSQTGKEILSPLQACQGLPASLTLSWAESAWHVSLWCCACTMHGLSLLGTC